MLADAARAGTRTVSLRIGHEGPRLFLSALLDIWQFSVLAAPAPGCLLLTDDRQPVPAAASHVVRLALPGQHDAEALPLPLRIEELWTALETRFHRPPRHHLRMPVHLPATVNVRGGDWETLLHSLSDAGARFRLGRELASGEPLTLSWVFDGVAFAAPAQVIYSFPSGGDAGGQGSYETGIIFAPVAPGFAARLRAQIVLRYLAAVRSRVPGWAFASGLTLLELPADVHGTLHRSAD